MVRKTDIEGECNKRPLRRTRRTYQRPVEKQRSVVSWKLKLQGVPTKEGSVVSNAAERPQKKRTKTYPLAFLKRSFSDLSENGFLEMGN